MSTLEVVENKISAVRKYLKILENYQDHSQQEIEESIHLRGAVERYLYLVIQATIDLASSYVTYKDLRKPTTMRESFEILAEEDIISDELTQNLTQMVGFRNIISHDYGELDYDIVYDTLQNELKNIKDFVTIVKGQIE